jgi:hypothetical protein
MRLLVLDLGETQLQLHPLMTVVNGLDDALRDRLVEVLAALPTGRVSHASGVIEAHGVMLDLTSENLGMLDLHSDIDVVVRRSELPGAELSPAARERGLVHAQRDELVAAIERRRSDLHRATLAQAAAQEALADARGEGSRDEARARSELRLEGPRADLKGHADARRDLETLVEETRRSLEPGRQATADAEAVREQARRARSDAAKACSAAAGELEAARGARDPAAAGALEAARQRVADLESGSADAELAPSADEADSADAAERSTIEELDARRALLEASLVALDPIDPLPVEVALRQLESDSGTDLVVSWDAEALAEEWAQLLVDLSAAQVSDRDAGQIQAVRKRLERARAALFAAEGAARLPDLDREQVDALENAHEAVLQAQDKTEKRLTGDRAKRRLEDARAAEQEILDRLGMHTYADFVMGTSMLRVDPEQEQSLDDARDELARAEDALAGLEAEVESELRRAELMARRRSVRDNAVALLGRDPGDDDIEWALRHHRVAAGERGDRSLRLRTELENAGLVLGDEDVPRSMLVELATIWLEELRDTAAERLKIEQELTELATALERAHHAADDDADTAAAAGAAELDRRRDAKLEEARAAVEAAEARVARHLEAEAETERRRDELARLTDLEQQAARELAAAEAVAAATAEVEHDAAQRLAVIEAELAAAADAERASAESLAAVEGELAQAAAAADIEVLMTSMEAAAETAAIATADVNAYEAELAAVDARLRELEDAGAVAASTPSEGELEWYLLARLAAQRAVSYAGSVPLVLDEALHDLSGAALVRVLERLERMSGAVQLIVLTDDPAATAWAAEAGLERALVLTR